MRVDTHDEFAARLLTLPPKATYTGGHRIRDYSLAVWLARRYGYSYPDIHRYWHDWTSTMSGDRGHILEFWRNDDPAARRSAEWMRNPNGDPAFPPPIAWHMNGGMGFHPPGWLPSVRLLITTEVEGELRALDRTLEHTLDMHWWNGAPRNPAPLRPDTPLPPPPPTTIAFPDEPGGHR